MDHTGPDRLGKDCGFYLNCIRSPPTRSLLLMPQKELTTPTSVPSWILRNPTWQHPVYFIVFSTYEWLISPQGQRLYSSLYSQGLAHLLAYARYYMFTGRLNEWGVKMNSFRSIFLFTNSLSSYVSSII